MSIRAKVIAGYVMLAIFAVSLCGYLAYKRGEQDFTVQAYSFLHSINVQKAEIVEQWLSNSALHLEMLANIPAFHQELAKIVLADVNKEEKPGEEAIGEIVENYLRPALERGLFKELFLLEVPAGQLLTSSDPRQTGKIIDNKNLLLEGQKGTHVESVYFSMSLQQPTMTISTPVRESTGRMLAVLAGRLDLTKLSVIVGSQQSHWKTEDTYLVNNQNFFITDPLYGKDFMLRNTIYTQGVSEALAGHEGASQYMDYRGEPVLGDYLVLKDYKLIQLTEIDQKEFYSPLKKMQRSIFGVAALVLVGAVLIGWGVALAVLNPLTRFVEKVKSVDSHNLSIQHDTGAPYEIDRLSQVFSTMLDRLKDTLVSRDQLLHEVERRKMVESKLRAALKNLHISNKELEQFAYVASHDLQEPLRMVTSYNQLLAQRFQGKLDEKADKYIRYSVEGAARMQVLIQDLLSYSRVTTKGREFVDVDLTKVVQDTVKNLEVGIRESEADIRFAELPVVHGDPVQLRQLFQNLIANGLKFRKIDEPPVIEIRARRHDDKWTIAVVDNGIGIEPGHEKRVFVIFKRLHTREEYSGTGIGLAICKRIVERHHGEIWYDSEVGHGSTFYFSLLPEQSAPVAAQAGVESSE